MKIIELPLSDCNLPGNADEQRRGLWTANGNLPACYAILRPLGPSSSLRSLDPWIFFPWTSVCFELSTCFMAISSRVPPGPTGSHRQADLCRTAFHAKEPGLLAHMRRHAGNPPLYVRIARTYLRIQIPPDDILQVDSKLWRCISHRVSTESATPLHSSTEFFPTTTAIVQSMQIAICWNELFEQLERYPACDPPRMGSSYSFSE